jgi:5'-3' exonuclease
MMYHIDADTLCYASAAVTEGTSPELAIYEMNRGVDSILLALNAGSDYKFYVTGENNFRYKIYPEYKANRLKMQRPTFLQACKTYLINEWGAINSEGCEADDLIGIAQTECNDNEIESCISSIDKDLDQISGWHYHPGIKRGGEYIREPRRYLVSPVEALTFFYYQLLVGDTADNIKGAAGIGPVKAKKALEGLTGERELYEAVRDYYSSDEELVMNARCLWIAKYKIDEWRIPDQTSIGESEGS